MNILLFDIETSPEMAHVWQLWKQNISLNQIIENGKILCFAAKWLGKEHDPVFFSSFHHGDEEMLRQMHKLFDEADAIVTYNGKKFDIPICNREFLIHNMLPPNPSHQIDLYESVKGRFRFVSNKLEYIAKRLGVGQKGKHIGHELWVQCMANNKEAWEMMKEYNIQDVVLLEKVYKKMLPWIKSHPNHALYTDFSDGEPRPVCPNCGSQHVVKKGIETTLTLSYQRYRCGSCGTPIRGRHTVDSLAKRKVILTQSKI